MTPNDETVEAPIPSKEYDWFLVNVNSTGISLSEETAIVK
jgi:hypothetical protein